MTRLFATVSLACLTLATLGCGPSGPQMIEVTGSVKYDGKAVTQGDITFVPEDKSVAPEGGKIKDGRYAVKVRDGKHKVKVYATQEVPGKKGPMGEDLVEQYIPKKYNEETGVTADVSAGAKEHNFDLKK